MRGETGPRGHPAPVRRRQEYLIYDEELDELLLYRRVSETFQLVEPAEDGRVYSQEPSAWFGREHGSLVRVYGPDREPVHDMTEVFEYAEDLERIRQHLEEEAASLLRGTESARKSEAAARRRAEEESRRADEERRQADERRRRADEEHRRAENERRRAEAVTAKNERRRAELEQLRRERGG
jgi:hypothetical protein